MLGAGESKDSTVLMARRIKELEEKLGMRRKELASLPSSH
jgi:hypothetical protein